jgi:hypothetical protein
MRLTLLQKQRMAEAVDALAKAEKRLKAARKRRNKLRATVAYYRRLSKQAKATDLDTFAAKAVRNAGKARPADAGLLGLFAAAFASEGGELVN